MIKLWVSCALTVLTVAAILALALGRQGSRRVREAWRGGYWTGRSELQESLAAQLAFYESELLVDPALLSAVLMSWVHREHLTNQTLAQLQGMSRAADPTTQVA